MRAEGDRTTRLRHRADTLKNDPNRNQNPNRNLDLRQNRNLDSTISHGRKTNARRHARRGAQKTDVAAARSVERPMRCEPGESAAQVNKRIATHPCGGFDRRPHRCQKQHVRRQVPKGLVRKERQQRRSKIGSRGEESPPRGHLFCAHGLRHVPDLSQEIGKHQ